MSDQSRPQGRLQRASARSAARLAAVQAVYQIEMTDIRPSAVVSEFVAHRLRDVVAAERDGDRVEAEPGLFTELVEGTYGQLPELDRMIAKRLTPEWPLDRLDSVLRALLRVATYEMSSRLEVPVKVVISEYLDVAHAFFTGKEPGLVNGVLDGIAHDVRAAEMSRDRG